MRLGLIALDSNTGLGNQSWEYAKHLHPTKVLDINLKNINATYGKITNHYPERFADYDTRVTDGLPSIADGEWLLDGIDLLFYAETPLNHEIIRMARERGIKTVMHYNYEFIDQLQPNFSSWPKPDLMLAPTMWNASIVQAAAAEWGSQWKYLPVPVNRTLFPFKQRTQAKTFLHVAGYKTHEDRNGTENVFAAIPLVKSDVQFIIRSQQELPHFEGDYRVKVINTDVRNYWESFNGEDVLLLPRRYGGLSLQLNEAMSTGMIPIMTGISPQQDFIAPELLIPAVLEKTIRTRGLVDIYSITPQQLAEKIDWLASQPTEFIQAASNYSDIYANSIDWETMAPKYMEVFEECLKS